jgi:hypothetical protein
MMQLVGGGHSSPAEHDQLLLLDHGELGQSICPAAWLLQFQFGPQESGLVSQSGGASVTSDRRLES